jgi:hypothetical protein
MCRRLALILALAAAPVACGSSPNTPAADDYATFAHVFSQLYCERLFSCCRPEERSTGMDDLATCQMMEEHVTLGIGTDIITRGRSLFDGAAATTCLRNLQNARCGALFSREEGSFIACQDVLKGLAPNGDSCDFDVECAGGRCGFSGCEEVPPAPCTSAEFFNGTACEPRRAISADCSAASDCLSTLTCIADHCAPPLADGQPCSAPKDCIGTCSNVAGQLPAVCRPAICAGP